MAERAITVIVHLFAAGASAPVLRKMTLGTIEAGGRGREPGLRQED
jgi:hypothetical protein